MTIELLGEHLFGQVCGSESLFVVEVRELSEAVQSDRGVDEACDLHQVRFGQIEALDITVVPYRDGQFDLLEFETVGGNAAALEHVHHLLGRTSRSWWG